MNRLGMLLVAPECPWPADIGLKTHLLAMLTELAAATELAVYGFYASEAEQERWQELAHALGFRLAGLSPVRSGAAWHLARLGCLLTGRPLAEARYQMPAAREAVRQYAAQEYAAGRPLDWVAYEVFHSLMGERAAELAGAPRRLLFPVDCYSLYYSRMHEQASNAAEWLRTRYLRAACARMERRLYRGIDLVATVAEPDAEALRRLLPGARVEVIPVPVAARPERRHTAASLARDGRPPRVLVAGYFGMPTIARDTREFLTAWAALPHRPAAQLVVWGRGGAGAGLKPDCARAGAELVEWVDDYDAFLASADVYVYPQTFACGVQTKIQQAMRAGLAVLASPDVMQPLGAAHGEHGWTITSPEAAARDLAALLGSPEILDRLGASGAALMRTHFSPAVVGAQLRILLGAGVAAAPKLSPEKAHDHLLPC